MPACPECTIFNKRFISAYNSWCPTQDVTG